MRARRIAAAVAALLASATGCRHGSADPAAAGTAATAAAPRLYVSCEGSGTVAVVDTATDRLVATIAVGRRPRGLRLAPGGRTLYVALSGSPVAPPGQEPPPGAADRSADGIAEVDLGRGAVMRVLPGGEDPEAFDLSPDGRRLYVSNEESGTASVVDVAASRVVATAPVGAEPEGVAVRPDGAAVYVTSERESRVTALGPGGEPLATFPAGRRPRGVAFSADGALAFVTAEEGATVTVADARRHGVVATVPVDAPGARPMGLALAPDGTRLFVSNGRAGSVSVIDVAARRAVATWATGGLRPWGIAVTPDGRKLYTANGGSDDVSVLDARTGEVLRTLHVGGRPWGAVIGR